MARSPRGNRPLRMAPPSGLKERLVAVFMVGLALFNPPLLAVFGQGGTVGGVPLLYVYLFCAWGGLIAALALIIESSAEEEGERVPDQPGPGWPREE